MSALPPEADVFLVEIDVCFVPLADTGLFQATSESVDYELRSISPEIKVELARLVPCGVTHHKITRNREIKRQTKHAVA